jgi:predicted O-methyltransferase YrrM
MDMRILSIDGWMSYWELNWLYDSVLQIPNGGLIVEIGAWKGRSTAALYTAMGNSKTVVTIDTWLGQPDLRDTAQREAKEIDVFYIFIFNMALLGVNPGPYRKGNLGAQYLCMESVYAAPLFENNSISMLFIDGDHSKAGEDIDAWYGKVKSGGIICGHDWHWQCVYEAVSKRFAVDMVIDTIWIKRK